MSRIFDKELESIAASVKDVGKHLIERSSADFVAERFRLASADMAYKYFNKENCHHIPTPNFLLGSRSYSEDFIALPASLSISSVHEISVRKHGNADGNISQEMRKLDIIQAKFWEAKAAGGSDGKELWDDALKQLKKLIPDLEAEGERL